MDYLVHLNVSEEIDNGEADPLTGNIKAVEGRSAKAPTHLL